MQRALLVAALWCGCQPPEAVLVLKAEPGTCPHQPVSAVRVSLLGDFPPVRVADGAGADVPPRRLPLGRARSLSIEGLSATAVAALGWSGPLPALSPGEERTLRLVYGAPDSLCQVWGLRVPRAFHRATLVAGDRVLVSGGIGPEGPSDTLEIYRTDRSEIGRALPLYEGAAIGHSATLLPDGTVLVAGGARPGTTQDDAARQRARLYHPDGEAERGVLLLEGGPRALHAAVRLADGQVLLSGGCSRVAPLAPGAPPTCAPRDVLASTVRYDLQGTFSPGPALSFGRFGHETYLLAGGRVLVVGGTRVDPATGQLAPALETELLDPHAPDGTAPGRPAGRASLPSAPLPAGGLLWASSEGADGQPGGLLLPEEALVPVAAQVVRAGATLTALPDGAALLAGGRDSGGRLVPALELYEGGRFRVLDDSFPRAGQAALPLPDGTVLLLGGLAGDDPSPLAARFVHGLRIADATPLPWPAAADEGRRWLVPRRPDRVEFDGEKLVISAPAGPQPRPAERALIAGVTWAGGELRVQAAARDPGGGAALLLAYQQEGDFHFVRLQPGLEVALVRVRGGDTAEVCRGQPAPAGAMSVGVRLFGGELRVSLGSAEVLRCGVELMRGAVGLGSLGGQVEFRGFSLVRGE